MAAPIGPWIAPTLVLCASLLFAWARQRSNYLRDLALVTGAGSVGGIIATAFAFSFPALYFLDSATFTKWLQKPWYFAQIMTGLSLAAGSFGIWIANMFEIELIEEQQLPFPIGQLVFKMISAGNQLRKGLELVAGFIAATILSVMQDGFFFFKGFIAKAITIVTPRSLGIFSLPLIRLDLWPMLWAIGFVTGHVIAVPLLVGALSKIIVIDPINGIFFSNLSNMDFVLAFCSGMVLAGAAMGFLFSPKALINSLKKYLSPSYYNNSVLGGKYTRGLIIQGVIAVGLSSIYLLYFGFSLPVILLLLVASGICSYQLAEIAGKMGLAPLGRYATFVMVPAMLLFKLNFTQIIIIATFVEVAGGVTADILFSRKMARLAHISRSRMMSYQYLGLVACSVSIGVVFWLFIGHLNLGSDALFAYKAQSRALLVNAKQFNYLVMALGIVFGLLLKHIKMNPALVLGGLLMPINLSLGLIIGGFLSWISKNKEEYFPFWSGVFAANSIWMLIKALW
ncbi:hypothetical protein Noda2021_02140 [Candidatus Dependentiae bacterium Noda2021]|nr:hypothetical protein Noda2021_02140 [Candidatus Dependentiae bacterium Noda2021]